VADDHARIGRRLHVFIVLAVVALVTSPIWRPGIPAGADDAIHLAEIRGIAASLRAGDVHLWNRSANAGFPSGMYYQLLPQLAVAIPSAILGAPVFWFKLSLTLAIVLAPLAGWRALRLLGFDDEAALGGAVAVAFASGTSRWGLGADGVFGVGLYTQAWALVCFPLAVAHGARYVRGSAGAGPALVWIALAAHCHPLVGIAALVAIACFGWRVIVLGALALVATAPLWVPLLTDRAGFGGFPFRQPDEAGSPPQRFLLAYAKGYVLDAARPPILSLLALAAALVPRARRLLVGAAIFAAIIMIGPFVGKLPGDLIPAIRFLAPLQVLLALAAGAGAVVIARRARYGWIALVLVGAAIVVTGALRLHARAGVTRVALPPIRQTTTARSADREAIPDGAGRVQASPVFWSYHAAPRPALVAFGGAALQSSRSFVWLASAPTDARRDAWVYDAPWRVTAAGLEELPSAGLVTPVRVVGANATRAQIARWLASPAPMRNEHLAWPGSGLAGPPADGEIRSIDERPSEIEARVLARAPTTFLARVSWNPRWRVAVDGEDVPVRRLSPDFIAADVPPGEHTLRFRFRRPWWQLALWPLCAAFVIAIYAWERRSRSSSAAAPTIPSSPPTSPAS
jgi:hypothetical protein